MKKSWILLILVMSAILPAIAAESKNKTRIALGDFKMGIIQGQKDMSEEGLSSIETALFSNIRTSLFKTKKFEFVERKGIDSVLTEISHQYDTGMFDPKSTVEFGALQGAELLILGTIVSFGAEKRGMGLGALGGQQKSMLVMEIELRIIDVQTGRYLFLDKVMAEKLVAQGMDLGILRSKQAGSAFGSNSNLASKGSNFQSQSGGISVLSELLGDVARNCVREIVLVSNPIKVAKVSQGQLFLNYGDEILSVGDILEICGEGEPLIDPDTGQVLGMEPIKIGRIEVVEATRTYSTAKLLSGSAKTLMDRDDLFCRPTTEKKKKGWSPFKKKKK